MAPIGFWNTVGTLACTVGAPAGWAGGACEQRIALLCFPSQQAQSGPLLTPLF